MFIEARIDVLDLMEYRLHYLIILLELCYILFMIKLK
jgi:hypothetical protein